MHNGIPTPRKYDKEIEEYLKRPLHSDYIQKNLKKILLLGAKKSILDCVDFLDDRINSMHDIKCDKVYFFLSPDDYMRSFFAFCSIGNKVQELNELIGNDEFEQLSDETMKYLDAIDLYHKPCFELTPLQLYVTFDLIEKKAHCLTTSSRSRVDCRQYNEKCFNGWFKEHGGNPKPMYRLHEKLWSSLIYGFFGIEIGDIGYERLEVQNCINDPTAGTVELDLDAIRSEVKLAMETVFTEDGDSADSEEAGELYMDDGEASSHGSETAKRFREDILELEDLVSYDYLEGETGFLAIKEAFDNLYPDDENPAILYYDNVADLIDEYGLPRKQYQYTLYEYIAVYDAGDCWHLVSLGMSELGAEPDGITKRYNAEYTMRIPKLDDAELDEAEWANAINLVSILADEACNAERMLEDYSYIGLGFRKGVDYKRESDKVAFIIVPDARISSIDGPFGTVYMRQAVPITRAEYNALKAKKIDVKTLYEKIGSDLVDYDRPSVI